MQDELAEKREMLATVNDAIKKIVSGKVQSYAIGKRNLTYHNLSELRKLRAELINEIAAAETPAGQLTGTGVAVFDRR
jgi:hypothetical protein